MNRSLALYHFLIALIVFCLTGCTSSKPDYHLLRLYASDPIAIMVVVPRNITFTKAYDTIDEISLESGNVPIDFRGLEKNLAEKIGQNLQKTKPRFKPVDFLDSSELTGVLEKDPRKKVKAGYALLESWSPKPPPPKEWTPQWEAQQKKIRQNASKNDPSPEFWLLAIDRIWGNGTRRSYLSIDVDRLKKKTPAKYLLVVGIDSVNALDRSLGITTSVQFRTRLISIRNGKMPIEFFYIQDMDLPGNVSINEILAENGKIVQDALKAAIPAYVSNLSDQINRTVEEIQ